MSFSFCLFVPQCLYFLFVIASDSYSVCSCVPTEWATCLVGSGPQVPIWHQNPINCIPMYILNRADESWTMYMQGQHNTEIHRLRNTWTLKQFKSIPMFSVYVYSQLRWRQSIFNLNRADTCIIWEYRMWNTCIWEYRIWKSFYQRQVLGEISKELLIDWRLFHTVLASTF